MKYEHLPGWKDAGQVKAEVILSAWRNYCMTSLIFRILVKIGLRN